MGDQSSKDVWRCPAISRESLRTSLWSLYVLGASPTTPKMTRFVMRSRRSFSELASCQCNSPFLTGYPVLSTGCSNAGILSSSFDFRHLHMLVQKLPACPGFKIRVCLIFYPPSGYWIELACNPLAKVGGSGRHSVAAIASTKH